MRNASCRVDDARREHELGCPSRADEAREALRAAHAGDDPDCDLGLAEVRTLAGDAQRARERELAPAAPRLAVDRGDDRLRHRLQDGERAGPRPRIALDGFALAELGEVVEIGVGDEVAVDAARQHEHRHVTVLGDLPGELLELAHRGHRHQVPGRPGEGCEGNGVAPFDGPKGHAAEATEVPPPVHPFRPHCWRRGGWPCDVCC